MPLHPSAWPWGRGRTRVSEKSTRFSHDFTTDRTDPTFPCRGTRGVRGAVVLVGLASEEEQVFAGSPAITDLQVDLALDRAAW